MRMSIGHQAAFGRLVYSRFDSKNDEHKELVDKGCLHTCNMH